MFLIFSKSQSPGSQSKVKVNAPFLSIGMLSGNQTSRRQDQIKMLTSYIKYTSLCEHLEVLLNVFITLFATNYLVYGSQLIFSWVEILHACAFCLLSSIIVFHSFYLKKEKWNMKYIWHDNSQSQYISNVLTKLSLPLYI